MRTTAFDTVNSRMVIDFGNNNQLVHDSKLKMAYKLKDGECIEKFSTDGMLLETFTQIVENIDKSLN